MNKYLRILVFLMIILNVINNKYRSTNLLILVIVIGIVVAFLDIYQKPTRRKAVFYSISAFLLALLYISLNQEWINPLWFI